MIRLTDPISVKLTAKQHEYLRTRADHETKSRSYSWHAGITVSDVVRSLVDEAMKIDAAKAAAQPKRRA